MSKNYQKKFISPEPPAGLLEKIIYRIHEERRLLNFKRRIIFFSVGLIGSIVALIPSFRALKGGLVESGFIKFLSLLFSDFGVVMTCWQNFALALLESLPTINIIVFLVVIFIFFGSLKFLVRDIKIIFKSA